MIDYIVVAFNNLEYIKYLVNSLTRHCVDPQITIVNNGNTAMYTQLEELKSDTIRVLNNSSKHTQEDYICEYDGRKVNKASWYHATGLTLAIEATNNPYITILDHDVYFVSNFEKSIQTLLEENIFVSSIYDKGVGIARPYFISFKRDLLKEYVQEPGDLYPNIKYKDTLGTMTLYANKNKKKYHILETTHTRDNHQQTYIENKIFMYHYHRGALKDSNKWLTFIKTKESIYG